METIGNAQAGKSTTSKPFTMVKGKRIKVVLEYYQKSTDGNPSVALLWSLLPSMSQHNPILLAQDEITHEQYDAVVVVVGGANNDQSATTEGEGVDRASLSLAGQQLALLQSVHAATDAAKIPMVTVLVDGKPTAEPYLLQLPAVIAAFQGGQAQGIGVASVVSGAYNPSGKLPVSFPASADVLPVFYNHKPSAKRNGWIDDTLPGNQAGCDDGTHHRCSGSGVLWSFGHGLSYTSFKYSNTTMPGAPISANSVATISTTVTNTGTIAGEEVCVCVCVCCGNVCPNILRTLA